MRAAGARHQWCRFAVPYRDIIAVGGSAGGIRALKALVKDLPPDLPACLVVALHLSPEANEAALAGAIANAGRLPVSFAREGDKIAPSRVFLAPPDRHLIVDEGRLLVRRGPLENRSRPAIDPLFRSVACSFRGRAIGVLLTGYLDDGVSGLIAIKQCGGVIVVQDPATAEVPDMPRNAVARAAPDHVLPLERMAGLLQHLAGAPAGPMPTPPPALEMEVRMAAQQVSGIGALQQFGQPSDLTCPECHGSLRQVRENDRMRYRCHTGHAFSLDSLALSQNHELERALISALRALDERVSLLQRLTEESGSNGHGRTADQFGRRAREYAEQAELIRNILAGQGDVTDGKTA